MVTATGQPPGEVIADITCRPQFDIRERQDIHVVDADGNEFTSFWQWLVLDDGIQQFRVPWGSPPLSRGLVELYTHQTYTFTVTTDMKSNARVQTVTRVVRGTEILYDATNKPDAGDGR